LRILIVSDIHGNAEALEAITESYDELWVLGDLVDYGPEPARVIDVLRARSSVIVRGNHDHAVGHDVDPRCSAPFRAMAEATRQHAVSTLSREDKAFLRDLPLTASLVRDGQRFFLCHASPSDPLFAYRPPHDPGWSQEMASLETDVLLVGHTHLPFVTPLGCRTLVNPGSVGQPKSGGPEASYAVCEDGQISLHRIRYAVENTIAKIEQLPIPLDIRRALAQLLQTGSPPD